jgi:hypothetical protein
MNFKTPVFDPKSVTVQDVMDALFNSGYTHNASEIKPTIDNALIAPKCFRKDAHTHVFLLGFASEEDDGMFYISDIHLSLNAEGLMCGEYGGNSSIDEFTLEDTQNELANWLYYTV